MKRVRAAVVGCGLIGKRRAQCAATHSETTLAVVTDVNPEVAQGIAAMYGCAWTTDFQHVVGDATVDCVVVSTPNDLLCRIGEAALSMGKDVLVEKPMGRNLQEARALAKAAEDAGRVLKVGFNHRYHPAIDRARAIVREGRIGDPINVRIRYGHGGRAGYEKEWRGDREKAGGGELTDQGAHVADLLHWILGMPTEAFAMTQTAVWPIGSLEDNAFGLLRYGSGVVASFHTSWTQWKNLFSLELFGSKGFVTVEGLGGSYGPETLTVGTRRPEGRVPDIERQVYEGPDLSWQEEWDDFVGGLSSGGPRHGTSEDGVAVMRILDALYRSAREGQPIRVS